ncbi:hypothetical protein [Octadecabacter ascidiaceicola]|uniref:Uncharacterized protein n=1 Tax=Octadecabacter ascidiaceicola TaxID=1655543 RepID=A0A238KML3_9RHOB|nr:hypothetical protein [Octadecabacter ascidiaceicola]SMX43392.1 hypothetical protein OCA8868_02946 [Octadecabacter ascidiaceicola]
MGLSEKDYRAGLVIEVNDRMQRDYRYELAVDVGGLADGFTPHYSPAEMLAMGVFEGKYCNDCTDELPTEWFDGAKTSDVANVELNYFGVKSRQRLSEWRRKGWIYEPDPRGWFQWYCRYYLGRRIEALDAVQIKRWRAFSRHAGQVRANCDPGDIFCRPRQRQGLLQWAHDPLI